MRDTRRATAPGWGGLALLAVLGPLALAGCMNNAAAETIRAQDAPRMVDLFRGSAGARERARVGAPAMGQVAASAEEPGSRCRCPRWAMWPCGPACVVENVRRRAAEREARRRALEAEGRSICRLWLFEWPCRKGEDGGGEAPADGPGAAAADGPDRGAAVEGGRAGGTTATPDDAAQMAVGDGGPPGAALAGDGRGAVDYTRTVRNELDLLFPRLPNPDILIYVYPHLATDERVPVPGYTTAVPLYERVEYALPGEMEETRR